MSRAQDRPRTIAVVTVHGTGDTADSPQGQKWFQQGSAFAGQLSRRLALRGLSAEIVPHLWSGANSSTDREKAAQKLAGAIRRLAQTHDGVHLVGHSHGGNVAHDAACILNWSHKQRRPRIASLTTVGTPFFRTRVSGGERAVAWSFAGMTLLSMLVLAGAALYTFNEAMRQRAETQIEAAIVEQFVPEPEAAPAPAPPSSGNVRERAGDAIEQTQDLTEQRAQQAQQAQLRQQADSYLLIGGSAAALGALSLFFVLPLALGGIGRIRRATRPRRTDTAVHSIWHANDEAIAFLQRVDTLQMQPFPAGSFLRRSRTGAIVWGVRAALLLPVISLVVFVVSWIWTLFERDSGGLFSSAEFLFGASMIFGLYAIVAAPLIFVVFYLVYRLFAVLVFEWTLRGRINRSIGNVLQGMAFGRDSDTRLCQVASCSHYYATHRAQLDGELAERMSAASATATHALLEKYRGGLFSVDVDDSSPVNQLAQDAMTWQSLIHTTYFDQAEIGDMIGDYIADQDARRVRNMLA